jgi:hypothetical protein
VERVWYVAYGSNVGRERFRCYLEGGRPPGGNRVYAGCRDTSEPSDELSVELPGSLVFAGQSRVWGGAMAFYDVSGSGTVAGRAYQVTMQQFADIAAQEMWAQPGGEFALHVSAVLAEVDTFHVLGPGNYETVHRLGSRDGCALMTVTSDELAGLSRAAPAPPYLWWIGTGLRDAHGWTSEQVGTYLSAAPGAAGAWTADDVARLIEQPSPVAMR